MEVYIWCKFYLWWNVKPLFRQSVEGSGFAVALRVNDGGVTAPYSLRGFGLEYQVGARR